VRAQCVALGLDANRIISVTADITEVDDLLKVRDAVVDGK